MKRLIVESMASDIERAIKGLRKHWSGMDGVYGDIMKNKG